MSLGCCCCSGGFSRTRVHLTNGCCSNNMFDENGAVLLWNKLDSFKSSATVAVAVAVVVVPTTCDYHSAGSSCCRMSVIECPVSMELLHPLIPGELLTIANFLRYKTLQIGKSLPVTFLEPECPSSMDLFNTFASYFAWVRSG